MGTLVQKKSGNSVLLILCIFWPVVNACSGFTVNTFWNFPESLFTPSRIGFHIASLFLTLKIGSWDDLFDAIAHGSKAQKLEFDTS